ncbi:MAG: hypothetical protein NTV34_11610, partial [Proteobacteria bacterium]|nr:hypothetical protein [Pseudomonadota bacterium]
TPYVRLGGRTAGSADNAHNTHMFMMNDSGVYYIDHLNAPNEPTDFTPENLLSFANKRKKKVKDGRLNFPRVFPYYFDSNRFNSNLEGSTIFFPVVDMSIQYINGLMYLLTQEPGFRPVFVDDKNGFIPAGVGKWIGNGFLNKEIVLPLSLLGTFRAQIEADLLMQNLMLALQAMGLGGWIHASQEGPIMMGHPNYKKVGVEGLDFDYSIPANAPRGVGPKL